MKALRYSQDYKEKIIEMRKYIDSYFGEAKRKEVFAKIKTTSQETKEYWGRIISVTFWRDRIWNEYLNHAIYTYIGN